MYYELALISVLVAGGYWGWYFVRHEHTRLYGALMLVSAALSGLGLLGSKLDISKLGIAGAIGVGGGACLLVLGPLARGLARRFAGAERFKAASIMLDVAEVLGPGSGVGDEKALLGAMREIRDGNIEQTVDALNAAKDRAPAETRLAIDERIAMLYLASYRWDEAIAHAEEHLFGAIDLFSLKADPFSLKADPFSLKADPAGRPAAGEGLVALRRALGIAPPVWVELLGAYGYKGDLDQAARMLARLEEVCAGRADAGIWLHRGRMIFLALAGRVTAVQTLVEPRRSRHMKPAARTYWVAVAHERQGEVAAAEAAYSKARSGSRGRPRVLIDQALARLATAKPTELGPTATEVVARVEAEPPPAVIERVRPRGPVATRVLAMSMLAVAFAVTIFFGPSTDIGVLVRDGALVRALVHEGQWWRVIACVFIHIGGLHLLVNTFGLWMLGRLVEDLFGPWRTFAIFAVAGIAGALASLFAVPAGISAGASGGLFGMLGAVFVELTWHRGRHRMMWTRGVWGSIAVVTVAQLGIGFFYPVTDQWAHGGGLIAGAVAGALLSPHAPWQKAGLYLSRALTIGFAIACIVAAVMVARTSIDDSLSQAPRVRRFFGTVSAVVPASWERASDELFDPDVNIFLLAKRDPTSGTLAAQVDDWLAGELKRAKEQHLEQVAAAPDTTVPLPLGWQGSELVASLPDPLGDHQRFRMIVAGRSDGDTVVLARLLVPESIARAAPDFVGGILASLQ